MSVTASVPGAIATGLGAASAVYAVLVLEVGSLTRTGAGLWPATASIVLALAGIALTVWPPPALEGIDADGVDPPKHMAAAAALGFLAVYALLVNFAGLLPASFVSVAIWVRLFGRESWLTSVMFGAAVAVGVQLLFVELLAVPI